MAGRQRYVIGLDGGTGGARAAVVDAQGAVLGMAAHPYDTHYPRAGWAEQAPEDWWRAAALAVRQAVREAGVDPAAVAAICADGTSSTVVALDAALNPTRPAILWMDNRASAQARRVMETGHPALSRSKIGVSSEWELPKLMWLKENQPAVFEGSRWFVEMTDYLALRLSGRLTLGLNQITNRWFYNPRAGGWPTGLFDAIGLGGIAERFPGDILPIGAPIGPLQAEAAEALGLTTSTTVVCGGTDAYVAMLGLDACSAGKTALITGSSHLVLLATDTDGEVPGIFGPHPDCVIPGLSVMEGGQVSSGSVIKWWNDHIGSKLGHGGDSYAAIMARAAAIPIGADGLVALDFWQGNRNPYTDYDLQGALWGLTLKHTPDHILRALLESVAFGTENILRTLADHGVPVASMTACGGSVRTKFWLQMHADVSGVPIHVPKVSEATVFGAAVAAATGAGLFGSLPEASGHMVHAEAVIDPVAADHERYREGFAFYRESVDALRPLMHKMARREGRHREPAP